VLPTLRTTSEYIAPSFCLSGTAVAQWLSCCTTNRKVAGSIPAGVSGFSTDIKPFGSHYSPGVDSASNRNEYQEYFLGAKAAGACRCVRLTILQPSCAVVTKSGNLIFLEHSGPVQACNGTALPLPFVYLHLTTENRLTDIFALLRFYAVYVEFFLGPLTLENGTVKLSRDVGKQLPNYAAYIPEQKYHIGDFFFANICRLG